MKFLWSSIVICTVITVNVNAENAVTDSPNPSNCDANDEAKCVDSLEKFASDVKFASDRASFNKIVIMVETRMKEVIDLVSSIQEFYHAMYTEMIAKQLSKEEQEELDDLYDKLLHFNSDARVFAMETKILLSDDQFTKGEIEKHTTEIQRLRQRAMKLQIELHKFKAQPKRQRIVYKIREVVRTGIIFGILILMLLMCAVFKDRVLSCCCCCVKEHLSQCLNQCLGWLLQVSSLVTAGIFIMLAWHLAATDWEALLDPITMKLEHLEQAQKEDLGPIHDAFNKLGAIFGRAEDIKKFQSEIDTLCDTIIKHAKMKVH